MLTPPQAWQLYLSTVVALKNLLHLVQTHHHLDRSPPVLQTRQKLRRVQTVVPPFFSSQRKPVVGGTRAHILDVRPAGRNNRIRVRPAQYMRKLTLVTHSVNSLVSPQHQVSSRTVSIHRPRIMMSQTLLILLLRRCPPCCQTQHLLVAAALAVVVVAPARITTQNKQ